MREEQGTFPQIGNLLLKSGTAVVSASLVLFLTSPTSLAQDGTAAVRLVREIERENPQFVERNANGLVVSLLLQSLSPNPVISEEPAR